MRGLVPSLVAGALILAVGGCTPVAETPPGAAASAERVPVREAWNVRFAVQEGGRTRARLDAAHLAAYEGDSTYTLLSGSEDGQRPVTVQLFDDGGQPLATLTAPRVAYLESRRQFVADGGVRVATSGGRTLSAERVVWDEAARRVEAPGRVRFTSPTEQFEGEDLSADERLDTYRFRRITGQATVR